MDKLVKLWILVLIICDGVTGAVRHWSNDIWPHNLDEYHCCDGKMCMCGGETIREQWVKKG